MIELDSSEVDLSRLSPEEQMELDRLLLEEPIDLLATLSPPMRAFVEDKSREKAAQCTRRAGKSYSGALDEVLCCQKEPRVVCIIIGKTYGSVKDIFWSPILKKIDRLARLGCRFNDSSLQMIFPNGSEIHLIGADANQKQREKLYGQKFRKVLVDEAEAFETDLQKLIEDVLGPAMVDYMGDLIMVGMPCDRVHGYFYEVTLPVRTSEGKNAHPQWSVHRWGALDNPHIADNFRAEIARKIESNPLVTQTPGFRQMYLNEWVVDAEKLVYRFERSRNGWTGRLPDLWTGEWSYVLGIDLGFNDASAFVVGAYHEHDPNLYVLTAQKQSKMDLTDVVSRIHDLERIYGIGYRVIDGANKQAVQEMVRRHGVQLKAAEKHNKRDFIRMLNDDLIQSRIKIGPDAAPLIVEWEHLNRRARQDGSWEEDPAAENHCADAMLYMWRHCYNYLHTDVPQTREALHALAVYALTHPDVQKQLADSREALACRIQAGNDRADQIRFDPFAAVTEAPDVDFWIEQY